MIPEKNVSRDVMSWIQMGSYEASIDAQKSEAKQIVIKKCPLLGCGYTFIDARNHNWQFHSDVIKPVEKKPIRAANTVTETQNSSAKDSTFNTEKNDEIANEAKSETVHEIRSVQKPKKQQ